MDEKYQLHISNLRHRLDELSRKGQEEHALSHDVRSGPSSSLRNEIVTCTNDSHAVSHCDGTQ